MPERPNGKLPPAEAALLARWHTAGRPPIPLFVDSTGDVQAVTTSLATMLSHRAPGWESFRANAIRWVEEHCQEVQR